MQVFYEGWRIVQALCEQDFRMPREVDIPNPLHREVARMYVERRDFAVADVIRATRKFAQPELLTTSTETVPAVPFATTVTPGTSTIISPFPRMLAVIRPGARRPSTPRRGVTSPDGGQMVLTPSGAGNSQCDHQ
jgi:hypothetical protein